MITVYESAYVRIKWNKSATFNVFTLTPAGWVNVECFTHYGADTEDQAKGIAVAWLAEREQ